MCFLSCLGWGPLLKQLRANKARFRSIWLLRFQGHRFWENKSQIPVIVVTADLTDNLYNQCNKMGIDNIVAKPFTQKDLAGAIDKAFDN